jgi:hypothetical protein
MNALQRAASAMGKVGGSRKSKAKAAAVRENGKLGGRPRQFDPCPRYKNHAHRFSPTTGRCACGYRRPNV